MTAADADFNNLSAQIKVNLNDGIDFVSIEDHGGLQLTGIDLRLKPRKIFKEFRSMNMGIQFTSPFG